MNWVAFSRVAFVATAIVFMFCAFWGNIVQSIVSLMFMIVGYIGMECAMVFEDDKKEEKR